MTIIYRTDGAWGTGKGSNLTPAEVDGNFHDLDGRVETIESNPTQPYQISNITKSGYAITIHLSDGVTEFGPYDFSPLPPPVVSVPDSTDDTFSPSLAQANCYFRCAAGCTVTIPLSSSVAFPIGTELHFRANSASPVVILGEDISDGTVTLNVPAGFAAATAVLGAVLTVKKVGADEWDVFGMLAEDVTA